ncbi:MAG: hypothetical protein Q8S33_11435 [Myxococcales bacterium]|nr:hypothetical protein [Myxococcales bacterium]
MPSGVDDRTQVQLVSLKAEAQVLKEWMARRADVARRRREGPVQVLRERVAMVERELPRLEGEVLTLEKDTVRPPRPPLALVMMGAVRGAGLGVAAMSWVVGLTVLMRGAPAEHPLRLTAMLLVVAVVALSRR